MAAAHDSRAPVLPASMCRHSSTESESRRSEAMSSAWPAIIAWVASASRAAARTRSGRRLLQEDLEGEGGEGVAGDDGVPDAVLGPQRWGGAVARGRRR